MYTGEVIDELTQMVARAEEHAQAVRMAEVAERDEREFVSHLMVVPDAQPMMIGVA